MIRFVGYLLVRAFAVVTTLLVGCSRFAHFSDPALEDVASTFCDTYKSAHMPELEDQARRAGISLDDVLHAFDVACLVRVKQAGPAGMGAVGLKVQQEIQR